MADTLIDLAGKVIEPLTEPAKEALVPPAKESGSYLGLKFRDRTRDERKRMLMAEMDEHFEMKAYQEKKERDYAALAEKVKECRDEIPVEDRIEPRESLIGPAIDAAEHYMGEEELRDMFAQRIASCYDGRKVGRNHPAFTAILQGLSPLDAQNLKKAFFDGFTFSHFIYATGPHVEKLYLYESDPDYIDAKLDLGLDDSQLDSWQSSSVNSLERAGLITTASTTELNRVKVGDGFSVIYVVKTYSLTSLGSDFCSICLPDPPKKES